MKSSGIIGTGIFVLIYIFIMAVGSASADVPAEITPNSIYFTQNLGQFGEKTLFRGESGNVVFYFCRDEVAYLFVRDTGELIEDDLNADLEDTPDMPEHPRYKKEGMLIRAQFIGANPNAEITGENRLPHNNNYFLGSGPSGWRTNVPNYSSVNYKEIYPGIDLRYYGNRSSLKYDFVVHPGADLSRIQIKYDGIEGLSISGTGDLDIDTEFGTIGEKAPYAYQEKNGITEQIAAGYEIIEPGVFGFRIDGDYDRSQSLVLDPQLVFSTYLGGTENDEFADIEVDSDGFIYTVGHTWAVDFPLVNPYQGSFGGGNYDVVVVKIDSSRQNQVFSTYLGGDSLDYGYSIAVDENLNKVFILASTSSTDFPLANPFQSNPAGRYDIALSVLTSSGDSLEFSTYFGGNNRERAGALALDNNGNVLFVGSSHSQDFPLVNPLYPNKIGHHDIILVKISYSDSDYDIVFSTFFGGSHDEAGTDIVVGDDGRIYFTGRTGSGNFPLLNAYDGAHNYWGYDDAFVAVISENGDSLLYSTYLGGEGDNQAYGIAVDDSAYIYVTGRTDAYNFPTINAYSDTHSGENSWDAFITVFSPDGSSLLYSTYLGGVGHDYADDIAVGNSGIVYVTGSTGSIDFPVVNAYDYTKNAVDDAFVAALDITSGCCLFSTYFGGNWYDWGLGIEVVGDSLLYFCGEANSTDFPLVNPIDSTAHDTEGYISIFSLDNMNIVPGGISGTVRTELSIPIPDVRVYLSARGLQDTTDVNGIFEFSNLCPGLYDITLSHGLYFDTVLADIFVDEQGNTTIVDAIMYDAWYPQGENCFDPYVISDTAFPIILSGNTSGFSNDYSIFDTAGICWQGYWYPYYRAGNGPDVVYSWVVPQDGLYNFYTCDDTVNTFDTDLFLWDNTCPHEPDIPENFICGADRGGCYSYGRARLTNVELTQGQEILIVVDGRGEDDMGNYELTITGAGVAAGVVTDSELNPMEFATVEAVGENISTITNAAGEYFLEGLPADYCDISFSRYHYYDQIVENVLINTGETTYVDVQMTLQPDEVVVWIGHSDGSPVPVPVGDTVGIDVYARTEESVEVAFIHLPLGTSDNYIVGHHSQSEGQFYYPFSEWDDVQFRPPTVLFDGWHNQSMLGFCDIGGPLNPTFQSDTLVKICSFAFETINDSSLIGDTVLCFMDGYDPANGGPLAAHPDGTIPYRIRYHFSPIYFAEPAGGCFYTIGDANNDDLFNGLDIVFSVSYFKGGAAPQYSCGCPPHGVWHVSGDVNASCTFNGLDVTYGVAYFKGGPGPIPCGDCPPLSTDKASSDDTEKADNLGIRNQIQKDVSIKGIK